MSGNPSDEGSPAPGSERALRLGTRASALALAQSGMVAAAVTAATGRAVELVQSPRTATPRARRCP